MEHEMHQIKGIHHVGLRVSDLVRSRAFYEQLGFMFVTGPIGPEPVAIMEHPCGVNINLILNGDSPAAVNILMDVAEKHAGYTHIALKVSDVAAVASQLRAADITITEGPVHFPGGTSIFIRDPDRNVVEFHAPNTARVR